MNTIKLFKTLLLISVLSLVAGCKLALMVSSGGDVTSLSQTRDCAGGTTCEFEITDATFEETFTAIPREGYVFSNWEAGLDGERYQCRGSSNPICVINNTALAGNVGSAPEIESGKIWYALPRFEFVGIDTDGDGTADHTDLDDDNDGIEDGLDTCPLEGPADLPNGCPDSDGDGVGDNEDACPALGTVGYVDGVGCPLDTDGDGVDDLTDACPGTPPATPVDVVGCPAIVGAPITEIIFAPDTNEWVQMNLFEGKTYAEVAAVCQGPGGECAGVLNGYIMDGWTWADSDQVWALLSSYFVLPMLPPSYPTGVLVADPGLAPFMVDFELPSACYFREASGITRDNDFAGLFQVESFDTSVIIELGLGYDTSGYYFCAPLSVWLFRPAEGT